MNRPFLLVLALVLWFQGRAFAADPFVPEILPDTKEVVLETKGGPQRHKNARIAPLPELDTTILYTKNGVVFPGQKAVLILYGGTGGSAAQYGIASSMTKVLNAMFKMGVNTIGFENPLYNGMETIPKYSDLSNHLDWLYKTISYVVERADKVSPGVRILVLGRSTGSSILKEAFHRYMIGDPRAKIMGRVDVINAFGINGHTPQDMERWMTREAEYFTEEANRKNKDYAVTDASTILFKQMTWQTGETPKDLDGVTLVKPQGHAPAVVAVLSRQDLFSSSEDQLRIMQAFADHHPGIRLDLFATDTKHDPTAGFSYTNSRGEFIKVETMERVKPILSGQIDGTLKVEPGFNFKPDQFYEYAPNRGCPSVLARLGYE